MSFSSKQQIARYHRIRDRQPSTAWSSKYEAAIQAWREEIPKVSRPSRISSLNRFGRTLHALSIPERIAILLALYFPRVFALLEQFALSPAPSPHPMQGHPKFAGIDLPQLPGTVAVFDGLGELDRHPIVRFPGEDGEIVERPDLFVADMILGIEDQEGPFCLHWSVKADAEGFRKPIELATERNPVRKKERFDLRMSIDKIYFGAADVGTKDFAADSIDENFITNLMRLFSWKIVDDHLGELKAPISALILCTDLGSTTPLDLGKYVWSKWSVPLEPFQALIHAMVWDRMLRIDLFHRTLLIDEPWIAERTDPLLVYQHLFSRR